MTHPIFNLGNGTTPFSQPKQSKALADEDTFMALHGGVGARLVFRLVEIIWDVPRKMRLRHKKGPDIAGPLNGISTSVSPPLTTKRQA